MAGVQSEDERDEGGVDDAGAAHDYFMGLLEHLNGLEGADRHVQLSEWASSRWFSACGFLLEGWQGALHREAWRCRRADLDHESPAKAWNDAPWAAGQATTARLLDAEDGPVVFYMVFPFRTIWTQEDEPWIAGAVGCPPILDAEQAATWSHLDIRHVILWNPKTGEARLDNEAPRTSHVIIPRNSGSELVVYGDVGAFFSAWAKRRLAYRMTVTLHGFPEDVDGHLPGALIIGDPALARWPLDSAESLTVGPGLTRAQLREMVVRSANLPRIFEGDLGHV